MTHQHTDVVPSMKDWEATLHPLKDPSIQTARTKRVTTYRYRHGKCRWVINANQGPGKWRLLQEMRQISNLRVVMQETWRGKWRCHHTKRGVPRKPFSCKQNGNDSCIATCSRLNPPFQRLQSTSRHFARSVWRSSTPQSNVRTSSLSSTQCSSICTNPSLHSIVASTPKVPLCPLLQKVTAEIWFNANDSMFDQPL